MNGSAVWASAKPSTRTKSCCSAHPGSWSSRKISFAFGTLLSPPGPSRGRRYSVVPPTASQGVGRTPAVNADGALPQIEVGAVGPVALRAEAVEVLAREPEVAAVGGGVGAAAGQARPGQAALDLPVALERPGAVARPVGRRDVQQPVTGAEREPATRRDPADEREEAAARRGEPRDQLVLEADGELLDGLWHVGVQRVDFSARNRRHASARVAGAAAASAGGWRHAASGGRPRRIPTPRPRPPGASVAAARSGAARAARERGAA